MWKEYVKEAKKSKKKNPYAEKKIDLNNPKFQRKIIDTKHAIERFIDGRHNPSELPSKLKSVINTPKAFKKVVDDVIKNGMIEIMKKYSDKRGNYGIHSKSTNINVIVDWRPNNQVSNDSRNHAIIVSVLPIKKNPFFTDIEGKIIVESVNGESLKLVAIIETY